MGIRNQNSTSYVHPDEPNLLNIHKAMTYDDAGIPHLRVFLGTDTITIAGDVNLVDKVKLWDGTNNLNFDLPNNDGETAPWSLPTENHNMVFNGSTWDRMRGNINDGVLVKLSNGNIAVTGTFWQATQPVSIATMPTTPVTGTFWQTTQPVSISSLPEIEIKNDSGNPIPVTATITDVITVVVNEDAGEIFALNNHATNVNRGWMMDNTMRPMISIRLNPATTTSTDLMKIVEYELGNNNANQSTIMYEWYEGDLTIAGAAIPAWTTVGTKGQYRVYQDQYSSNQGNTFTIPSGTVLRHSGIIIGKNTSGDGIDKPLIGGNTGKIWTLCLKRLDNATKLDVWFAFTFKELT